MPRTKNIYEGIVSFPLVFLVYKIREEAKQGGLEMTEVNGELPN